MPRIDPVKLLTCISSLLSPNGGIRSSLEVKRLVNLMGKYSKKLVSKCIYIQILKSTETELLGQFMTFGGWSLVHTWLSDGIDSKNWPLVQELLELLLLCPVDVPRLQSNTAPKLVKSLSREDDNEGVRILAAKLVEQWLKIARGEISSQSTNVINKENLLASQSQIIVNNMNVENSLDCLPMSEINENDVTDSVNDSLSERDGNEGLVFKITVRDGKQTLAKVSETSPKKNHIKDLDGSTKSEKKSSSSSKSSDSRSKDGKDREKNKDRHHKKSSSSSSSSHKSSSSSGKSSSSSSSKHSSSSSSSSKSHSKSSSNSSSNNSSSHKSSSSSSSSSRDKDRSKSKSKSSSSSSSSSSSKERREKDEKSKVSQAEKDKDTLAKIALAPPPKVKIPKKSSDDTEKPTTENGTSTIKKKSISIEVRKDTENRPKTAKTYNSQFRNHGLAEEAPPPPSRRDLKKPSSVPTTGLAITPTNPVKRSLSPTSTVKEIDKKMKLQTPSSPTVEKPGAIKLIPPKAKPSVLIESDMFMDAMTAATTKKEVRKRKRIPSAKEGENNGDKANQQSKDGKDSKPAPLRFYQDTLEENENKDDASKSATAKSESNADDGIGKDKKPKTETDENEEQNGKDIPASAESPEEAPEEPVKREPGPGCGPDGPPGVLTIHRRKGPKKSLRWRPQEALEEIRYFELDETERVNVTKTFVDMKQMERVSERENFLISRKVGSEDTMVEQMEWQPLILVDDVPELAAGTNSKEKDIQAEREKTCLKTIYFNRASIPDSPHEPDVITFQNVEPPIIPLEDVTGNPDATHDFTSMPWPDPKGSPPADSGNFDNLGGVSNFGSFGQFNNLSNWPNQNSIIGLQPPTQIGFGQMLAPDAIRMNINPMQQFNTANLANMAPMMQQPFNANNVGFLNNFGQQVPPMLNDNRSGNRGGNNWFSGNNNPTNNNWQSQGGGNNNQRQSNWIKNRRNVCTAFQRGFCRHGDKCKYLHTGGSNTKF